MPSGITLKKTDDAAIPTPATDKATIFLDDTSGEPSYKDDGGTVHTLVGAVGDTGPEGPTGPPGEGATSFHGVRVFHSEAQPLASGSYTTVEFDSTDYDTDEYHDDVTDNSRLTVPAGLAGHYLIWFNAAIATTSTGQDIATIWKNGTDVQAFGGTSSPPTAGASHVPSLAVRWLDEGDYIELRIYQNSGASRDLDGPDATPGDYKPTFGMALLTSGPGPAGPEGPEGPPGADGADGTGSGTLTTIEEVDGSPTDSAVTKLVFPNGTLGIASHVATYTPAAAASSLLAITAYNPTATDTTISTTTQADLDATNVKVTFTAPASGNVLVRLECKAYAEASTARLGWGLRESTTDLAGPLDVLADATTGPEIVITRSFYLTGVSAGSHTYKWAVVRTNANCHMRYGGAYGQIIMEVWAAP
jgi:hypothetical protein